jgi:hypothetical protein
MNQYRYTATFDRIPMEAVGTIEAESADQAGQILRGVCGSWFTETGHEFSAGCPAEFELSEV